MKAHAPCCYSRHLAISYFSTQSHKQMLVSKECGFRFSLQLLSEIFLILRRNEHDITIMYISLHVKYPVFFLDFNETWIFPTGVRKSTGMLNFMKILPVGAAFFHADGQKDMTQLIVASRNFPNPPRNECYVGDSYVFALMACCWNYRHH